MTKSKKNLWDEDFTQAERVELIQDLINTGTAWKLEGAIGREAMGLIEAGLCVLGTKGHRDFYGNYVPSRTEVEPGTKGSLEYREKIQAKI